MANKKYRVRDMQTGDLMDLLLVSNGDSPETFSLATAGATGSEVITVGAPLNRRSDATSVSVALSTEDAALLTAAATPATQTISAAALPLPTGAATSALQAGGLPAALGQGAMAQSLRVVLASDQSTLTTQQAGFSFANMTTNTTTTHKSGAGVLHLVVTNTGGTGSTATIYDSLSGSGAVIGTIATTLIGATNVYDIAFATGLTIVTAGAGAADITVSYR